MDRKPRHSRPGAASAMVGSGRRDVKAPRGAAKARRAPGLEAPESSPSRPGRGARAMLIVDAQVHIWGSGTPLPPHRQTSSFTTDELLAEMDAAGVGAALIHPPGWDPHSSEIAVDAARQHPNRLAILGRLALDRPETPGLVAVWKR